MLKALAPIIPEGLTTQVVRGQYIAGYSEGKPVPGYLEEPNSNTQSDGHGTFVALRADIRTGAKLGRRLPAYRRKRVALVPLHPGSRARLLHALGGSSLLFRSSRWPGEIHVTVANPTACADRAAGARVLECARGLVRARRRAAEACLTSRAPAFICKVFPKSIIHLNRLLIDAPVILSANFY